MKKSDDKKKEIEFNAIIKVDNPFKGQLEMRDVLIAESFYEVYEFVKKISIYPFELNFDGFVFELNGERSECYSYLVELANLHGLDVADIKPLRKMNILLN